MLAKIINGKLLFGAVLLEPFIGIQSYLEVYPNDSSFHWTFYHVSIFPDSDLFLKAGLLQGPVGPKEGSRRETEVHSSSHLIIQ